MLLTQLNARALRGRGFRPAHLLLVPLREAVYVAAWARAALMPRIRWRGNVLHVLPQTRLATPEALARARKWRARRQRAG